MRSDQQKGSTTESVSIRTASAIGWRELWSWGYRALFQFSSFERWSRSANDRYPLRWKWVLFEYLFLFLSFLNNNNGNNFPSRSEFSCQTDVRVLPCWALHSIQWFNTENLEAFLQDIGCGFAENDSLVVDSKYFPGGFVLLDAVASIVEVGKCSG